MLSIYLQEEKAKAKRKENTALLFDPKKLKQQLLQKQAEENAKKNGSEVEDKSERDSVSAASACFQASALPTTPSACAPDPASPSQVFPPTSTNASDAQTLSDPAAVRFTPTVPTVTINQSAKPNPFLSPKKPTIKRPTTANGQFLRTSAIPVSGGTAATLAVSEEDEMMEVTEIEGSTENVRIDREEVSKLQQFLSNTLKKILRHSNALLVHCKGSLQYSFSAL